MPGKLLLKYVIKENDMSELFDKIRKYCKERSIDVDGIEDQTDGIAIMIAYYAHRNQKRENESDYIFHPLRCADRYRELLSIDRSDNSSYDTDMIKKFGLPYVGVEEVCILHDVAEDTDLSIADIESVYREKNLGDFFDEYVKKPLELLTHDKNVPYDDYIDIVLTDKTAAMVKMLDMADNSTLLSLESIDERKLERTKKYLDYIKIIDEKYDFLFRAMLYRRAINYVWREYDYKLKELFYDYVPIALRSPEEQEEAYDGTFDDDDDD